MPAYVIVNVTIEDPVRYEDYRAKAAPTLAPFGGRYLVRGGAVQVMEGSWSPSRLVLLEFPSAERARAWWGCDEYEGIKAIRQAAAKTDLVIVEGVKAGDVP